MTFADRRAQWLRDARLHHDADVRVLKRAEDIIAATLETAPKLIEFRVRKYRTKKPAAPQSGAVRPVTPGWSPPSPIPASHFSQHDERDWVEFEYLKVAPRRATMRRLVLVPLDMGRALSVPSGAMFYGGDRAWRRETSL